MPMPFQFPSFSVPLFNRGAAQPQDAPHAQPQAQPQTPPQPESLTPSSTPSEAASSTPSTISAVQSQVRSLLQGDSIYTDSPALSSRSTPKAPFARVFHRGIYTPGASSPQFDIPRDSSESQTPLYQQQPARSYRPAVLSSPQHGAPVVEPPAAYTRESSLYEGVDPETAQLAILINQRAKKRQQRAWVRRRNSGRTRSGCGSSRRGAWGVPTTPIKKKAMLCLGSGIFLAMVLTTYLSIALTRPSTGQEIHVLFILIILSTTILFCHSLVRLVMLSLHPRRVDEMPRIPDVAGPDGFQPDRPIRVHLARDEELGEEADPAGILDPEKGVLKAPPPAYGLWRSSVPINPNLLHWQRVDGVHPLRQNPSSANPDNAQPNQLLDPFQSPEPQQQQQQQRGRRESHEDGRHEEPRPPSYISDDGVRYVVDAEPRSVAPAAAAAAAAAAAVADDSLSDVHPAYRGGLGIR